MSACACLKFKSKLSMRLDFLLNLDQITSYIFNRKWGTKSLLTFSEPRAKRINLSHLTRQKGVSSKARFPSGITRPNENTSALAQNSMFGSVVVGAFQIIFRVKMHANDVFLFFKNHFWHQHIKTIQRVPKRSREILTRFVKG